MTVVNVAFHSRIGQTVAGSLAGMRLLSVIRISLLSLDLLEHSG